MKVLSPSSLLTAAVLACCWSASAVAQARPAAPAAPATAPAARGDARAEIARKLEISPDAVRPSAVPGLFEVADGADVGYVSTDGKYYIDGDVFDLDTRRNITELRRQGARVAALASVADAQAIVFAPARPRFLLNVFTDIDCGYCRKLHTEIAELNKRGVKVRYLLYPRSGPGSESWKKAEAVWCSADRGEALTRAKRGEAVTAKPCATQVAKQYQLGKDIGLRGTPALVTADGQLISGYMPADQLVAHLEELQGGATQAR